MLRRLLCLLAQEFKRIGCRLYWLCMKGVSRAMDHHSSGCLPAEKFPTCASDRQGRGGTTLLGFHHQFHLTRSRDVAGGRITGIRGWICATSSLGSPVIIVQVRTHSPDSGSFQFSQRPAKVNGRPSLQEVHQAYDRVRGRQLGSAVFISDLATELQIGFPKATWMDSQRGNRIRSRIPGRRSLADGDRGPKGGGDRTSRFQAASYPVLMVFQTLSSISGIL
jgi:hypothetical protein